MTDFIFVTMITQLDGRLDEALVDLRKAVVLCPRDRQIRCVYSEV